MANFEAVTSSNGLKVLPEQAVPLKALLDKYVIEPELDTDIKDGEFAIYGYFWFSVYAVNKDEPDGVDWDTEMTDEFLNELRQFVPEGEKFIIQSIGYEKCRYPLSAMAIVVSRDKVEWHNLPS